MSIEKVRAYFASVGLAERIQEFEVSSATVALAAEALHCEPARIAKTLSFVNGEGAILIVAAGDARVDNPKFKAQFGVKAKMLTPEDAVRRARTIAAPQNAQRFGLSTPCSVTGACGDCHSESCICNQMVITRNSKPAGRIKVILVGEDLGF